jgi:hypothetical protein
LPPTGRYAHQFFCDDFLHGLDLEITLGNQLLQPRILGLELLQAPDVVRLKATRNVCAMCRRSAR